jgi:hypothetical protein
MGRFSGYNGLGFMTLHHSCQETPMRFMFQLSMCVVFAALHGTPVHGDDRSPMDTNAGTMPVLRLHEIAASYSTTSMGQTLLNVSVESAGSNLIVVAPGSVVSYSVIGLLGDDDNQGLALVGFDLDFDGGPLAQANEPTGDPNSGCENPMIHFDIPWGVTNPAGFGGTIIGGDLIQVGGGQNTINNSPDNPFCAPNCAPYPIGTVLPGVAQPAGCGPAVLVTGSLTAPIAPGMYSLALENLFANIITSSTTGIPFWQTQAAGVGTITNLTIVVEPSDVPAASEWGLVILLLLGLVFGSLVANQDRQVSGHRSVSLPALVTANA